MNNKKMASQIDRDALNKVVLALSDGPKTLTDIVHIDQAISASEIKRKDVYDCLSYPRVRG
jgi:hypothetical protein